jgi:hypothetical protein
MIERRDFSNLEECRDEIRRLREENYHLRQASLAFGELAERLRNSLERERRTPQESRWARPES